jgi:hypothetical protein
MSETKAGIKSARISDRLHRHLTASAKYFGCSVNTLIMLLLDTCSISEFDSKDSKVSDDTINKYYEHVKARNYLFKD